MEQHKVTQILKSNQPYHLVNISPWPLACATSALLLTLGAASRMSSFTRVNLLLRGGILILLLMMTNWWTDAIREGTTEGEHTQFVQVGLRFGMFFFIISEILFFFGFFWAFFHLSFNPSIVLGGTWPPVFLTILNTSDVPLLNTVLLLVSGSGTTWIHGSVLFGSKWQASNSFKDTLDLAILFTALQAVEYFSAPFTISQSVYGSSFYMATGFHGFHVFVGTTFIGVCVMRLVLNHFCCDHHFGFEAAAWYWHFVDLVWLFLFATVYWWGS